MRWGDANSKAFWFRPECHGGVTACFGKAYQRGKPTLARNRARDDFAAEYAEGESLCPTDPSVHVASSLDAARSYTRFVELLPASRIDALRSWIRSGRINSSERPGSGHPSSRIRSSVLRRSSCTCSACLPTSARSNPLRLSRCLPFLRSWLTHPRRSSAWWT